MRCSDCNKFVSFDDSNEPEADDADIDAEGRVSGTVRVYLTCAECGTELKEASFDLDVDMTEVVATHAKTVAEAKADKLADALNKAQLACSACAGRASEHCTCQVATREAVEDAHEACELEVEVEAEQTSRTEGKGRGTKTFYGFHATLHVKCSCGHEFGDEEHSDDMQASHMDELS